MSSGITHLETIRVELDGQPPVQFGIGQPWASGSSDEGGPRHYWHYGFRDHLDPEKLAPYTERWPTLTPECWPSIEETIRRIVSSMEEIVNVGSSHNDLTWVLWWHTGSGTMAKCLVDEPRLIEAHKSMLRRAWPARLAEMEASNASSRDRSMASARTFRENGYPEKWVAQAVSLARTYQRNILVWRAASRQAQDTSSA